MIAQIVAIHPESERRIEMVLAAASNGFAIERVGLYLRLFKWLPSQSLWTVPNLSTTRPTIRTLLFTNLTSAFKSDHPTTRWSCPRTQFSTSIMIFPNGMCHKVDFPGLPGSKTCFRAHFSKACRKRCFRLVQVLQEEEIYFAFEKFHEQDTDPNFTLKLISIFLFLNLTAFTLRILNTICCLYLAFCP